MTNSSQAYSKFLDQEGIVRKRNEAEPAKGLFVSGKKGASLNWSL